MKNIVKFLQKNLIIILSFLILGLWIVEHFFCYECGNTNVTRYLSIHLGAIFLLLWQFLIWKRSQSLKKWKVVFFIFLFVGNISAVFVPVFSPISFRGVLPTDSKDLVVGLVLTFVIIFCFVVAAIEVIFLSILSITKLYKN